MADLTGQTFGRLTVLGRSDKRGPRGKRTVPLWECRCECGAVTYKATDTLKNDDVCMCRDCAGLYASSIARKHAGYIEGTQVSRLNSSRPNAGNISGVRGVTYDKSVRKWHARLTFRRVAVNLGYYEDFSDAVAARKEAEEKYYGGFLEEYEARQVSGKETGGRDEKEEG